MVSFSDSLDELSNRMHAFMKTYEADNATARARSRGGGAAHDKKFIDTLEEMSAVVQQAEGVSAPNFTEIVDRTDKLFSTAIKFCYNGPRTDSIYDFMPSFAHVDAPSLIEDEHTEVVFSSGLIDAMLPFIQACNAKKGIRGPVTFLPKPKPWSETYKPHAFTNPHSRFRKGDETLPFSGTPTTPLANVLLQARFECTSSTVPLPVRISLSTSGQCVAVASMGASGRGYKSSLVYYLPDHESGRFPKWQGLKTGLSTHGFQIATDEERKLIFIGDEDRTKSFAWGKTDGGNTPFPTHTLRSSTYAGPVAVLPGGRFIRAGRGSVGVWNIDALETHGPNGDNLIGKAIMLDEFEDYGEEEVKESTGSKKHSSISLLDPNFVAATWKLHPNLTGVMLCGSDPDVTHSYSCVGFDLEHGGKIVTRYLGNGGTILGFSTSEGDNNVFATACNDGYARLFDVRHALPVLTIDGSGRDSGCPAVALAHPDGVPLMFTGGDKSEQIMTWDLRARKIVYDMATGNNAVTDLAWDANSSTLWASTECTYLDRSGRAQEYRRPKIRRPKLEAQTNTGLEEDESDWMDDEEEGDGQDTREYEDDDDLDENENWPIKAYHGEDYYGHTFDASDHSIFRCRYREEPNLGLKPSWGFTDLNRDW